ncbi:MAG TPA: hypothetical protein VG734_18985 [Lacunisphaera sp.]|nr:hypothetical protein [Lacunisphaera sp.]
MRLPKKKARIVLDAIATLQDEQVIGSETAATIRAHVEPIAFDWRRLARYSFIISLICIVIAVLAAVFDDAIIRWFERVLPYVIRLFNAPPPVRSGGLFLLSAAVFWLGVRRRAKFPERVYSNEAIFTFGTLGIAGAVYSLSKMVQYLDLDTYLITLAGCLYLILGATLASKIVWCYGLFTLSAALGNGTGYEMGGYYLWQDTPVMSLAYGLVLAIAAVFLATAPGRLSSDMARHAARLHPLAGVTRVVGLLHVFISLWILSIWGSNKHSFNRGDFRLDCLIWMILFGAVAAVAVARSLEKDDAILRGFGLTFFFINLYTALFQYFWNGLHKALFFAILGASFWLLGRKAESLWKMKSLGKRARVD